MGMLEQMGRLIDSDYRLAAFESPNPKRVIDLFRSISRDTGQAIYYWTPNEGMYRLGSEHILVPDTALPRGALRFIDSTNHFAVFLLQDFASALEDKRLLEQLKAIVSAEQSQTRRLVILLGQNVEVPKGLRSFTVRVRHAMRDTG